MENNNVCNTFPVCPTCNGEVILAMARVPMQTWTSVYDPDTALARGTLFPALDLPYLTREAK
ncbi:MAG: spore coat associated protein CotJA [Oscillospiraceae bacterium]